MNIQQQLVRQIIGHLKKFEASGEWEEYSEAMDCLRILYLEIDKAAKEDRTDG